MVRDPEFPRFLPPGQPAPTMETFARLIGARRTMQRDIGYTMWAVDDKATGSFIGQCGIRPAQAMDPSAGPEVDLAYHFVRRAWGHGYATEAAVAVLTQGLGPIGLGSIMAVALPENIGSWRVMEKAGMRYEGLADLYGLRSLKKYIADREWWRPPSLP